METDPTWRMHTGEVPERLPTFLEPLFWPITGPDIPTGSITHGGQSISPPKPLITNSVLHMRKWRLWIQVISHVHDYLLAKWGLSPGLLTADNSFQTITLTGRRGDVCTAAVQNATLGFYPLSKKSREGILEVSSVCLSLSGIPFQQPYFQPTSICWPLTRVQNSEAACSPSITRPGLVFKESFVWLKT